MVRHAHPARDAAAIAAIYAPSVDRGVASFEAVPPTAAEMERRIAEGAREYPWLVAERDGGSPATPTARGTAPAPPTAGPSR